MKLNLTILSLVSFTIKKTKMVRLELRGIFFQLTIKNNYSYFDEITNHENVNDIVTPVYT